MEFSPGNPLLWNRDALADNAAMDERKEFRITINKWLIVAGAVVCLSAAGAIWYFNSEADSLANLWSGMLGALTRVGLILAALGLVVPRGRTMTVSWKIFLIAVAALVGIALRPKLAIPLMAILVAVAVFLRPRDKTAKQKRLARRYRKQSAKKQPSESAK